MGIHVEREDRFGKGMYNVGDKVRVRPDLSNYSTNTAEGMFIMAGQVVTIRNTNNYTFNSYGIKEDNNNYDWEEWMLQPLASSEGELLTMLIKGRINDDQYVEYKKLL